MWGWGGLIFIAVAIVALVIMVIGALHVDADHPWADDEHDALNLKDFQNHQPPARRQSRKSEEKKHA